MSTDAKVLIQIQGDTQDINAKLANLGNVLSTISTHTKNVETIGKSTWAIYATGINQVIDLAGKAVNSIKSMVGIAQQMALAYGAQEQAEVKLTAVLAAHGVTSEKVTKALARQAETLMLLTGESDESILSTQAMMLSMGVLPSKLEAATRAALDLSRLYGKDLQASAMMVAQAMEGNTTRITRLIPALKGMEKGALDADGVLRKLHEALGGLAEKEGDTYLAQVRKLTQGWGEFKETIGKEVIPTLRELIKMARDGIVAIQGFLGESSRAVRLQQLDMLERKIAEAEKAVGGDRFLDFKIRATTATDPKVMLEKWRGERDALKAMLDAEAAQDTETILTEGDKKFKKEPSHALDSLIKKWQEGMPKLKLDVEFAGAPGGGGYFREMAEADAEALKLKEEYSKILKRVVDDEGNTVENIIDQVAAAKKLSAEKKAYMEFAKMALDVDTQLRQRAQDMFDLAKKRRENEVEASRDELELGRRNLDIERSDYTRGQIASYDKLIASEKERFDLLDKSLLTEKQFLDIEEEKDRKIKAYRHQIAMLKSDLKVQTGTGDEGFARGIKEWLDETQSAYEQMRDFAKGTAQAMSASFGEFFFDLFEGRLKTLGDYLTAFGKNVARMMADILGQMAAKSLISGVSGGLSGLLPSFSYHQGGHGIGEASGFRLVPADAFAAARRYHSGLTPDEVPMIAQRREMPYIFTPEQMKAMGGRGATSVNVPVTIQYGEDQLARKMRRGMEDTARKILKENF